MRTPDHNDAELILKLYDLRRETVMRQARAFWGGLNPKNFAELKAITEATHPQNAYFRQVTSYWEMAASFVNRQILHPDVYVDNCGEGLFVFAKLEPFLKEMRETYSPFFMTQTEKVIQDNRAVQQKFARILEIQKSRMR